VFVNEVGTLARQACLKLGTHSSYEAILCALQ